MSDQINYPGFDATPEEQQAAAEAAMKATERPGDAANRRAWLDRDQPTGRYPNEAAEWKRGSRQGGTRGPDIAGTASLDAFHFNVQTDDPIEAAQRMVMGVAVREAVGSDEPRTIRATITDRQDRLAREIAILKAVIGDEPSQPDATASAVTLALRKELADLEGAQATLDKLLAATPVPAQSLEQQMRTIERLLPKKG